MRRIISFGPQEDRRGRDDFDSTVPSRWGPAFLVVENNNTRTRIVLGGGYLITDIQMSTAGRLSSRTAFHSRLVAALRYSFRSGLSPRVVPPSCSRVQDEGGGGPSVVAEGPGRCPLIRRGGLRGAGTRQGPLPILDHPRRNSL